jgi:hypothetical protein
VKKRDSVKGSGGFVFMLEVDVNVSVGRERKETLDKGVYLFRGIGSGATKAETCMRSCGVDFRRS